MKTCRLTNEVIEKLYANWIAFYNKRVDAINYLRAQKLKELNDEATFEVKRDVISKNDLVDWYEVQLAKIREWMDSAKVGLEKAEELFNDIYQKIKEAVYTEEDIGWTYIYDFYKSEIRKIKSKKENVVSVKFSMYHWDYTFYPFKVEKIQFVAPKVKFTPWVEE